MVQLNAGKVAIALPNWSNPRTATCLLLPVTLSGEFTFVLCPSVVLMANVVKVCTTLSVTVAEIDPLLTLRVYLPAVVKLAVTAFPDVFKVHEPPVGVVNNSQVNEGCELSEALN